MWLGLVVVLLSGLGGWVAVLSRDLPHVTNLQEAIKIDRASQGQPYTPLDQVPPGLVASLVAIEDARFYRHAGIDWIRLAGATWNDVKWRHMAEGGSTLTEQLVKNTVLAGKENGVPGKVRAMLLSGRVEQAYTKEQILELYLNAVYYGRDRYGIGAAAAAYFGVLPADLDPVQQLFLAGILQGPALYEPNVHCAAAWQRIQAVIRARLRNGTLSAHDADQLRRAPLIHTRGICWPDGHTSTR